MLYRNLSGYFREKYNKRIKKICIDGGFTCPNRDGRCGYGGCIFCGERGAGEHIDASLSIKGQIESFFSRHPNGDGFIAYFQNFTNTYAPVDVLKERYDSALIDERIIALAVGTRPDCITEEIASLLVSYKDRYDVWVELGLQSADDETARIINRGYETSVFTHAMEILKRYDIPVVVHIIIGLPGETKKDVLKTVSYINTFDDIWGIKIHSIYVMEGTVLGEMYKRGEYKPISEEEYVDTVCEVLINLKEETVIHRLTGDCPENMLLAPLWNRDKNKIINDITKKMAEKGWTQGMLYGKN